MDIKKIKEHCEQGTHIYVPDTNLLVHIGESILTNLEDNAIVLCGTVLQELDKLKGGSGEAGYNARRVISFLTGLMDETDGDFNEIFRQESPVFSPGRNAAFCLLIQSGR